MIVDTNNLRRLICNEFGNLTKKLAQNAKSVIAIEKDHRLTILLHDSLKEYTNIKIIEADILTLDPTSLPSLPQDIPQ